jgi:hypothetical protein
MALLSPSEIRARGAIECLRSRTGNDIGTHIEVYRLYLKNGGKPLIDEAELAELRRSGYMARAKTALHHLRTVGTDKEYHANTIKHSIWQGEFEPKDVGLTAEECGLYKIQPLA